MDDVILPYVPPKPIDDPSLRKVAVNEFGPDIDAVEAPVPEVKVFAESGHVKDLDKNAVTHVVIQLTIARQTDIFHHVGYQYDWDWPAPFWHFLGKTVDKALFDGNADPRELNFVALGRREFIAFTTSRWRAAVEVGNSADAADLPPLNVIEVSFNKLQPGQPLEMTWAPARGRITGKIRDWNAHPDKLKA